MHHAISVLSLEECMALVHFSSYDSVTLRVNCLCGISFTFEFNWIVRSFYLSFVANLFMRSSKTNTRWNHLRCYRRHFMLGSFYQILHQITVNLACQIEDTITRLVREVLTICSSLRIGVISTCLKNNQIEQSSLPAKSLEVVHSVPQAKIFIKKNFSS